MTDDTVGITMPVIETKKATREELIAWLTEWYRVKQNYKHLDFNAYFGMRTDRQLRRNVQQIVDVLRRTV